MRLNLGAADRHCDGFVCIDIAPPECAACGRADFRTVDLSGPWPWGESAINEVLAFDVCEHVGDCDHVSEWLCARCIFPDHACSGNPLPLRHRHPLGRIHFLNELHRVLVPGGRATIETPNAAKGVGYFQDPTHCSPYCLSTFKYFEAGAFARERPLGNGMTLGDAYGITARFKVISLTESQSNGENPAEQVWKIKAVLEAVK